MCKCYLGFFVIMFFSGCAGKSPFIYEDNSSSNLKADGPSIAIQYIIDKRTGDTDIDESFETDPLIDMSNILKNEIESTGYFSNVYLIEENSSYLNTDHFYIIRPYLINMKWEIPNYEDMIGNLMFISLITGGLGGIIYGSTETDVLGDVSLNIVMENKYSGHVLIDKQYNGHSKKSYSKFVSDSNFKKSRVIGYAFSEIMSKLKSDIKQASIANY